MKTTVQMWLASVAGLSVLLMIVFATSIQVAPAAVVGGGGAGSGTASSATPPAGTQGRGGVSFATTGSSASGASSRSSASTGSTASASTQGLTAAQRHHFFGPPQSVVAVSGAAGTQGRGGVALAQSAPAGGQASTGITASRRHFGRFQPTANVLATQTGSSSATSKSAWIAAGSAAAIFLIGLAAWSLTRRRGQSGGRPSEAYCARHPDDALCSAG